MMANAYGMVATNLTTVGDIALVALAFFEAACLRAGVNARTELRRRMARGAAAVVLVTAVVLLAV